MARILPEKAVDHPYVHQLEMRNTYIEYVNQMYRVLDDFKLTGQGETLPTDLDDAILECPMLKFARDKIANVKMTILWSLLF